MIATLEQLLRHRLGLFGLMEIFNVPDNPGVAPPYSDDPRAQVWYRIMRRLTWYTLTDRTRYADQWPDFDMLGIDISRRTSVEQDLYSKSIHIARGTDRVVIAELNAFSLHSGHPDRVWDTRLVGAVTSERALGLLATVRLAL